MRLTHEQQRLIRSAQPSSIAAEFTRIAATQLLVVVLDYGHLPGKPKLVFHAIVDDSSTHRNVWLDLWLQISEVTMPTGDQWQELQTKVEAAYKTWDVPVWKFVEVAGEGWVECLQNPLVITLDRYAKNVRVFPNEVGRKYENDKFVVFIAKTDEPMVKVNSHYSC